MTEPNYNESVAFLRRVHPSTFWTLTAIPVDEGRTSTSSFTGADDRDLLPWLERMGANHNIYYALNPLRRPLTSKAKREDVKAMAWLHVDVDPRAGEDIEAEQERAVGLLREPPGDLPKPTAIIFSGGGYQALWRLDTPVEINGQANAYEEAKRYNQQLELIFGADNCHNVDRIMRLPGTINHPNAKKRKRGRKAALAELVEWHDDRVYPLTDFTPLPAMQTVQTGFMAPAVQVSGNVERVMDLDKLPDEVPGKCKILIAQGSDPDDPTKYESRSEVLFAVCCMLVRGGCDDDTIFSILTDPDWAISESVLEKKSGAQRYALRQIERARENAIDPNLLMMNERHAVIGNYGGKPRVIEETYDPGIERYRLTKSTFQDIQQRYCNKRVKIGDDGKGNDKFMPLGQWWIAHERRREYDRIVFQPNEEVEANLYNMWRGFSYEPQPGHKHEAFLKHVLDNVCSGNEKLLKYVVGWMANAVQNPGEPGHVALVMRGDQGVGKGFFASTVGKLFGRHYLAVSNAQHLTGNFNSHLRDCCVLFADEAFYAGDKRHASVLKTLITESTLIVEAKGVDSETSGNCLHLIMASNEDWVVPAGMNERRFCVLDVSSAQMQQSDYFGRIADDLKSGGYEALLHYLLSYDLSGFNVRDVPKTKALQDQKMHSFTAEEEWWYDKLQHGLISPNSSEWPDKVVVHELVADYTSYTQQFNITKRGNSTKLGKFLSRACPSGFKKVQGTEAITVLDEKGFETQCDRPYLYLVPPLEECRKHWDEKFGGPYSWGVERLETEQEDLPF